MKYARTIAVMNRKGGTGKSTTVLNLGAALTERGAAVLILDLDAQGSLSFSLGIHGEKPTLYELIYGESNLEDVVREQEGLFVIPASSDLADLELSLVTSDDRVQILKKLIGEFEAQFDFILLDCAPSLSVLTLNALTAADEIIVPLPLEVLTLHGASLIFKTIRKVRESYNPGLRVLGLLPVMVDMRSKLSREVYEYLESEVPFKLLKSNIRQDDKIAEAPSFGKSVLMHAPESDGAEDYRALAFEVLKAGAD